MTDYKNLPLERENIDNFINTFAQENNLELRSILLMNGDRVKRVTIGRVGIDDCIVDLHLINTGATTVNWKVGQNKELGKALADYLLNTTNTEQLRSVNFSLKGITEDNILPIIDEMSQCLNDSKNNEFTIEEKSNNTQQAFKITSTQHDDFISITHYKTTNKLLIQGKTLFTYRRVIYLLSELLDLKGLQSVLSCTEENTASIVRKEVAEDYLKEKLPNSYEHLPSLIKRFMCAGCCVKLASPTLPEYSMLLFPDLRALEGILKTNLGHFELNVSEQKYGFGHFFTINQGNATLGKEFKEIIDNSALIEAIEKSYAFLALHRNTLFHMEDFAAGSRKIDTLEQALSLSSDAYTLIDSIYQAKT